MLMVTMLCSPPIQQVGRCASAVSVLPTPDGTHQQEDTLGLAWDLPNPRLEVRMRSQPWPASAMILPDDAFRRDAARRLRTVCDLIAHHLADAGCRSRRRSLHRRSAPSTQTRINGCCRPAVRAEIGIEFHRVARAQLVGRGSRGAAGVTVPVAIAGSSALLQEPQLADATALAGGCLCIFRQFCSPIEQCADLANFRFTRSGFLLPSSSLQTARVRLGRCGALFGHDSCSQTLGVIRA